ncbi:hypothetical protein JRO89_XS02G0145600 [Xanthoceras sorbifolium]|uniref:Retrovirus-related Pol polyprotein from transposon TNT 1-94 n=1 Tax=Xanthoceras sorbifolium TaxID=99658 RepID=A0ABQ8IFW9_9ROSI|nr:hypothetical protein JRO89_XS02G0145600 [Xanthoceras sorbifolium]
METKFEAERFIGTNDFGLWKMKMKAVLVKEGLDFIDPWLGRQSFERGEEGNNSIWNLGSLVDNMDEFKRLIQDLENMSIEMDDEDQIVILLNSLPRSYENFVDTLKYGRQTIKFEEIEVAIIANGKTNAECLMVRGRT